MKKSTLALSIAAAIGSLGLAGAANATVSVNSGGIGHKLVFPYFSAQGDNATLLSITNTDTTNGKLVKVRFRGAANSDDLFDFQVLMSPGDVWTAAVSKDATTGKAMLSTSDKSCTLPASVNSTFNTDRLDPSATDEAKASGTREGYVEVINMGDISASAYNTLSAGGTTAAATSLFKTVKHVAGVAPCATAVLQEKLGGLSTAPGNAVLTGEVTAPTTGLTGDWIILNQANTAAWSGSATALHYSGSTNTVFWPQKTGAVSTSTTATAIATDLANLTADPLLTSGVVTAQYFDLPDLSTKYESYSNAAAQADAITAELAVKAVRNQFVTSDDIAAVTDMLFAQPTRRYHVAVNYTAIKDDPSTGGVETSWSPLAKTGKDVLPVYRDTSTTAVNGTGGTYYNTTNMAFPTGSRTLCLNSITTPSKDNRFDREELTPATSTTDFVISPRPAVAATTVFVCGEAAVMSINNGGTVTDSALSASVARNDVTFPAGYENGWLSFNTAGTGNTSGLPILGASFVRMANGAVNYGVSYGHKTSK
ncbi:cell surface protein [Limnohabitans sp.]|uniref:cell surface protein n=1 Tax=Limnohabitans sp. TaxID=1907725 RepID=UPI0031FBC68C